MCGPVRVLVCPWSPGLVLVPSVRPGSVLSVSSAVRWSVLPVRYDERAASAAGDRESFAGKLGERSERRVP